MPAEKEEKTTKKTTKKVEPVEKKQTKKVTSTKKSTSKPETKTTKPKANTNKPKSTTANTKKKTNVTEEKKVNKQKGAKKEKQEEKKNVENLNMEEIEKTVQEELKSKKVIPIEEQKKMNGEVFKNLLIAIAIEVFFNFIILGFINIEQSVFIVDLKVFAVSLLAVAIGTFEYAYKKDSGKIAIYGIEMLVLALCMLAAIYIDIMLNSKFVIIAILTTYAIAIYF